MTHLISLFFILIVSCGIQPKYPDGGFDYPENLLPNNTNFYYYPLKKIEPQEAAFYDSYSYLFYKPFHEPNLSIRPQPNETFRLTYGTAFGNSVIITFNEDSLTIKKGSPSVLYFEDTSRLSEIENFHLRQLKMRFPIDTVGKPPLLKRYLDSLTKLYPQLLDPVYYHKLYNKTLAYSNEKFSPLITKIALTKQQYTSVIEQINSSGFWTMPYDKGCEYPSADGDGFTFEANTKKKYKVVRVTGCPNDTTKFTKACQRIIEMAKLNTEINFIWSEEMVTDFADFPKIIEK